MLTAAEKYAYRRLLYWAMLDIRVLGQPNVPVGWNPLKWREFHFRAKVAGELADWLHNLALYAARDFEGFDPEQFWQRYTEAEVFRKKINQGWYDYRQRFERDLAELKEKTDPK